MRFIEKLNEAVASIETFFLVIFLAVMVFLGFFQVILRDFFSYGFTWADELLRNIVLWSALLGASLATKAGRHINIDIITRNLRGGQKVLVEILIDLISGSVCFILFEASIGFIRMEMEYPQVSMFFNLPVWVFELVFPIFFIISTIRFMIHALDGVIALLTGRELRDSVVTRDLGITANK